MGFEYEYYFALKIDTRIFRFNAKFSTHASTQNTFLFALHKPSCATHPHISSHAETPDNEQIIIGPLILATLLSAFQQRSRAYDETRNFERIKFNDKFRTNESLSLAKFGLVPLAMDMDNITLHSIQQHHCK